MEKYNISGRITLTCTTKVEAESKEEALKIAQKRELAEFHMDYGHPEDEFFHIENDSTPKDLEVE